MVWVLGFLPAITFWSEILYSIWQTPYLDWNHEKGGFHDRLYSSFCWLSSDAVFDNMVFFCSWHIHFWILTLHWILCLHLYLFLLLQPQCAKLSMMSILFFWFCFLNHLIVVQSLVHFTLARCGFQWFCSCLVTFISIQVLLCRSISLIWTFALSLW